MNKVLDGLTREEALACLYPVKGTDSYCFCKGAVFLTLGGMELHGSATSSYFDWVDEINSYYDNKESTEWIEPKITGSLSICGSCDTVEEVFYNDMLEEITYTNAHRKVDAFISANIQKHSNVEIAEELLRRYPEELKLAECKRW